MKIMKKIFSTIICLLLVLSCLSGCVDSLFTTQEFKQYQSFSKNYKVGMKKERVIKRIGYPDSYRDLDGNNYRWNYREDNKEDFQNFAFDDTVSEWHYDCYELSDPANPYRLHVYFDSDGKCTNVDFEAVRGG